MKAVPLIETELPTGLPTGAKPVMCGLTLNSVADAYGVDELVIVTITHDPKARRRSYERLAQVFGLGEGAS